MKSVYIAIGLTLFAAYLLLNTERIAPETEEAFKEFVVKYRKSYASEDQYGFRLGVFNNNLKEIDRLRFEHPKAMFDINEFADLTIEEREALLGWKEPEGVKVYRNTPKVFKKKEVDWKNFDSKIKNQGSCGSCWAFAAAETLESSYAIHSGKNIEIAPQQFVDCTKGESDGCNGGWMDDVFDYVKTHKVCTEEEYKYTARDGKCKEDKCNIDLGLKGRVNVAPNSVEALLEAAEVSPLSVAVDASPMSFYRGGILEIRTDSLNHGMVLVGYNVEAETPYVVLRNSWGERWGDHGYVKVSLEHNGGITKAASYPDFGDVQTKPGIGKCKTGEDPNPQSNCLCTYGEACDKKKPHGKDKDGCDDECGCGEFGFCR